MKFQNQEVLELQSGSSRVLIDPAGGRLLLWEYEGRQVIYWPQEADWSKPTKIRGGNPVLFPFVARHMVDGKVGYWKDSTGLVREMPMHGFGRESLYEADLVGTCCTLTLRDTPLTRAYYPYAFKFQVVYTLGHKALEVKFHTENLSAQVLPYYAGHHFYFAIPHQERATWEFAVDSIRQVRQNLDGSISSQVPSPKPFLLNDTTLSDSMHILSGSGPVYLRQPQTKKSLAIHLQFPESAPWYAVTSWTEKSDSNFYCLEPWLGLPNAIHHGQGLRNLEPGKKELAQCRIELGNW